MVNVEYSQDNETFYYQEKESGYIIHIPKQMIISSLRKYIVDCVGIQVEYLDNVIGIQIICTYQNINVGQIFDIKEFVDTGKYIKHFANRITMQLGYEYFRKKKGEIIYE